MAGVSKNSKSNRGTSAVNDKVLIRWVKKARMFCRTEFTNGKQTQTWHSKGEKPNG